MEEKMIDIFTAASVNAAMKQDFPDHLEHYWVRERSRRRLALHEAFSLVLTRWQRRPQADHPTYPVLTPPL
jgi:hypothetical protein